MIVEQGKYANKEPLFASAVTRLCLGEQSLLLSFSPVHIDSPCTALWQLLHCITMLQLKQPIVQVKLCAIYTFFPPSPELFSFASLYSFLLSAVLGQGLPVLNV